MRTEEEQNVSIKACNNAQITCNFSLLKLYFVGIRQSSFWKLVKAVVTGVGKGCRDSVKVVVTG